MGKEEYAKVIHEINTWYDITEYSKHRILSKAVGDYIYTFENFGYNEYRIFGKKEIYKTGGKDESE